MMLQRLIPLFSLVLCRDFERASGQDIERFEPLVPDAIDLLAECPVPELNLICTERCEEAQLECILGCENDVNCISACIRDITDCFQDCPCEIGCPDGCDNCHNPVCECEDLETNQDWNICIDENGATLGRCVYACNGNESCENDCLNSFKMRQTNCPCEENCIGGCPCESYFCLETTTSPVVTTPTVPQTTTSPANPSVLVLNTYNSWANKPMIIDFDGNVNDDIDFEYGEGTNAVYGCGTTLFGQFWYFGGSDSNRALRQASKIEGCKLVRQEDLPFDFYHGSCNTFLQPTEKLLLCFDYDHPEVCYTFDGEYYRSVESSKYSHRQTLGLANYRGNGLTTGCNNNKAECSFKTEIFDMTTMKWSNGPNYPFAQDRISYYSTASTSDAAYIIGGYDTQNVVAEFKDNQWRQLDNLNKGRDYHGSLSIGDQTIIIGGVAESGNAETELWQFSNGNNKVINTLRSADFIFGIGIYPVNSDYCRKN